MCNLLQRTAVHCCLTSTQNIRTIRDGEFRTATSTFTQLSALSPGKVQVQCRFTSTETIRTIRDGEPRTATSTVTQLLSSVKRTAADIFPLIIKFTRGPFCQWNYYKLATQACSLGPARPQAWSSRFRCGE